MPNLYLVHVNMKKAKAELKSHSILKHNKNQIRVWVKAENPDSACSLAIKRICNDIVEAARMSKPRAKHFIDKLRHLISVTKVEPAS